MMEDKELLKPIKWYASLNTHKGRRDSGCFLIEGERSIDQIKDTDPEAIVELLMLEGTTCPYRGIQTRMLTNRQMKEISESVTPPKLCAVVRIPENVNSTILPDEIGGRVLLLEDIQDPGNLGTILRTTEAAGVNMVIMSEGCADIFNPKVIRSTMGSIFRLPFVTDDLVSVIEMLKTEGVTVYGAALEGSSDYREVEFSEKTAIVIGNEGNGISGNVLNAVNEKIRIPMKGQIESLNAAVSAAILLYHIYED